MRCKKAYITLPHVNGEVIVYGNTCTPKKLKSYVDALRRKLIKRMERKIKKYQEQIVLMQSLVEQYKT